MGTLITRGQVRGSEQELSLHKHLVNDAACSRLWWAMVGGGGSGLKESNFGENEPVVETIVVHRAFGTVVARTLRMREVQCSTP